MAAPLLTAAYQALSQLDLGGTRSRGRLISYVVVQGVRWHGMPAATGLQRCISVADPVTRCMPGVPLNCAPPGEEAEPELAAAAGEAHAAAGQVLSLLAWCNLEGGEAEQALACVQALRQLGEAGGGGGGAHTHFAAAFLSLRVLLQLGR